MDKIKYLALLILCFAFLIGHAQPENGSFRKKGAFGIGVTPLIGISNTSSEYLGNTTKNNNLVIGSLVTGTFNITKDIVANAGVGYRSDKLTTSQSANDNTGEDKTSGLVFQVGVSKAINIFANPNSALDVLLGAMAICTDGNRAYANTFNGVTTMSTDPHSTSLFGLTAKPEWFITEHFSIHTQIGVAISFLNEDNSSYSEGGINVHIFSSADLLGQSGFTFYF